MTRTQTMNALRRARAALCEDDQHAVDRVIAALWGNDQPLSDARQLAENLRLRDPMAEVGIRQIVMMASK